MRKALSIFYLIFLGLCLFGCSADEDVSKLTDTSQLLILFASLSILICLALAILTSFSIWESMILTLGYIGALCVITSPIAYAHFGKDFETGICLFLSGVIAVAISLTLMKATDRVVYEKEEDDDDDDEEEDDKDKDK